MIRITARRTAASILGFGMAMLSVGCGLLDVSDPTADEPVEVANANGANMMRRYALSDLYVITILGALSSGLLADEFLHDQSPSYVVSPSGLVLDQRDQALLDQSTTVGQYGFSHETRLQATRAIAHLRQYGAANVRQAHIGQMLTVRGYALLNLAEHYCAGFPLSDVVDERVVYGPPLTTTAAIFERALADFDSALVYTADSVRLLHVAQVGRARTLLGLGRFADAAIAATSVPTDFAWLTEHTTDVFVAHVLAFTYSDFDETRVGVADREGGIGLDFVSANDPRVPTPLLGPAYDGVTGIYAAGKYPTNTTPVVVTSGIEARLIEAEAALSTGGDWLGVLNGLRQTQISPTMADLTDPGSADARVDLLFRERAFWLFATGHRLGDLRRLVRLYHRTPESVFPTGAYRLGGTYGTATSMPFNAAREAAVNPAVTGCTEN